MLPLPSVGQIQDSRFGTVRGNILTGRRVAMPKYEYYLVEAYVVRMNSLGAEHLTNA